MAGRRHPRDGCDALFVRTAMVDRVIPPARAGLGVRLTPEDVVKAIFKAGKYRGYGKVHLPTGWTARLLHEMGGADRVSHFVASLLAA